MIWTICILFLIFTGCEKPQERHYTEVVVKPSEDARAMLDPHAGIDMSSGTTLEEDIPTSMNTMYSWIAPTGWKQSPGQGMRLASFHLTADEDAIDCSVISLSGMAGGLEANLRRWMGQIGLEATASDLEKLIGSASTIKIKGGQEGKVFDFTTIQDKAADKSMIVVMLGMDEATLFVKMTGTLNNVKKNSQDFFKLVQSIEPQ